MVELEGAKNNLSQQNRQLIENISTLQYRIQDLERNLASAHSSVDVQKVYSFSSFDLSRWYHLCFAVGIYFLCAYWDAMRLYNNLGSRAVWLSWSVLMYYLLYESHSLCVQMFKVHVGFSWLVGTSSLLNQVFFLGGVGGGVTRLDKIDGMPKSNNLLPMSNLTRGICWLRSRSETQTNLNQIKPNPIFPTGLFPFGRQA